MAKAKPKTMPHVVNEKDMEMNPELAAEGVKVGDEIQLPVEATKYYYLIKVRSYVSDAEIWEAGLYETSKRIPRLDRSKPQFVECFEETVPDRTLMKLAEQFRLTEEDPEEILATLVIKK